LLKVTEEDASLALVDNWNRKTTARMNPAVRQSPLVRFIVSPLRNVTEDSVPLRSLAREM
jgi:hypothetical protein